MPTNTVHDPVCHIDMAAEELAGTSTYDGKEYAFCSPGCKAEFDANPIAVLQAEAIHHAEPKNLATESSVWPWWKFWAR